MKNAARSKTVWFGLALILLDTVPQIQALLVEVFPDAMARYGLAIAGVVVVLLRFVTNQPIQLGRK